MASEEITGEEADAEQVLDFWFADAAAGPEAAERRQRIWFSGGEAFDQRCSDGFSQTLAAATRGRLDHWKTSPRGRLALIVLLDQFSRNIYRGTAAAFAQDAQALALCREGIELGHDMQLSPIERTIFYMPLEHAEDWDIQALSVRQFEALAAQGPAPLRTLLQANVDYVHKHRDIIETFGRFPHRNTVLGRQSTPEEEAYLANDAPRFGQ
jgi:uncharacterized protein (DUF924 family)